MFFLQRIIISAVILVLAGITVSAQTYNTGTVGVAVNDYGRVRLYTPDVDGARQIERISLLAGVDASSVFDYYNDGDSITAAYSMDVPTYGDFEVVAQTNNNYSGLPPNVILNIYSYGWQGEPFTLVKYEFINKNEAATTFQFGFELIPIVDGAYGFETIKYDASKNIVSYSIDDTSTNVGFQVFSHDLVGLKSFEWYDGYNSDDADLFAWLTYGAIDTTYTAGADGSTAILSVGDPIELQADESVDIYVGMAAGDDYNTIAAAMKIAKLKYEDMVTSLDAKNDVIPENYSVSQNYPNPFNPSTKINFAIPEQEYVTLKVYNMVGEMVAELVNQELTAGDYTVDFNASNLSSGIYFYNITAGAFSRTGKMTLLK